MGNDNIVLYFSLVCVTFVLFILVMSQLELTPKEQAEKKKLIDAAFGDWSRKDFRAFVAATERHGRCARDRTGGGGGDAMLPAVT